MSFDTPTPGYNASDPTATYLNVSCLDLLLIEMVPLAERMARRAERLNNGGSGDVDAEEDEGAGTKEGAAAAGKKDVGRGRGKGGAGEGSLLGSEAGTGTGMGGGDADEGEPGIKDAVVFRLDALGYRVGQGLSERFSRDRPRLLDNLDVIKFVCKDLWTILFKKQIDNLKTNHRGVYVLTDNTFRPFMRMSMPDRREAVARAQVHLHYPAGLIRGALSTLGIATTVQADCSELPQAVFQIKTKTVAGG